MCLPQRLMSKRTGLKPLVSSGAEWVLLLGPVSSRHVIALSGRYLLNSRSGNWQPGLGCSIYRSQRCRIRRRLGYVFAPETRRLIGGYRPGRANERRRTSFTNSLLGVSFTTPGLIDDGHYRDPNGSLIGLRSGASRSYYLLDGAVGLGTAGGAVSCGASGAVASAGVGISGAGLRARSPKGGLKAAGIATSLGGEVPTRRSVSHEQ